MKKVVSEFIDYIVRIIHPSKINCKIKCKLLKFKGANIDDNVWIDIGVVIKSPGKLKIGSNAVLSCYTIITAGGGIEIDDDVMIGYNCKILSQNHIIPRDLSQSIRFSGHRYDKVHIKRGAWIASDVTILPGVTIGEGAVVAAGSVVTKDVEPNCIYAGVPAKKIRNR